MNCIIKSRYFVELDENEAKVLCNFLKTIGENPDIKPDRKTSDVLCTLWTVLESPDIRT